MLPRQLLVTATDHSQYNVVLRTVVIESVEALGTRQGNQKNGFRASAHPDRAASKRRRLCTNERHGKTCGSSWYYSGCEVAKCLVCVSGHPRGMRLDFVFSTYVQYSINITYAIRTGMYYCIVRTVCIPVIVMCHLVTA
jgi:hypothetical protein